MFLFISSHVTLPKELSKQIPPQKLLSEAEWRALGIQMSLGWEHYATHKYLSFYFLFNFL